MFSTNAVFFLFSQHTLFSTLSLSLSYVLYQCCVLSLFTAHHAQVSIPRSLMCSNQCCVLLQQVLRLPFFFVFLVRRHIHLSLSSHTRPRCPLSALSSTLDVYYVLYELITFIIIHLFMLFFSCKHQTHSSLSLSLFSTHTRRLPAATSSTLASVAVACCLSAPKASVSTQAFSVSSLSFPSRVFQAV